MYTRRPPDDAGRLAHDGPRLPPLSKGSKGDGKRERSQMNKMSKTICCFTSYNSKSEKIQTSQMSEMSCPPFSIPIFAAPPAHVVRVIRTDLIMVFLRGNHLSDTTCLTQVFFNSGE